MRASIAASAAADWLPVPSGRSVCIMSPPIPCAASGVRWFRPSTAKRGAVRNASHASGLIP
jgi:hypothetical protein